MCPSCFPALPLLAGTVSSGGLIFGLRALLNRLQAKFKNSRIPWFTAKEKQT
jgi:hypothetical protein